MRIRPLLSVITVVVLVAGGLGLRSVDPHAEAVPVAQDAHTGGWFCPHGGGAGWAVRLVATNPGPKPVPIRVTTYGKKGPLPPRRFAVPPESVLRVPIPATTRGSSSQVEYFGDWVGVSWIAFAGGNESGLASEPCASSLGHTWLMPDNTTVRGEEAWVVVMNPTATPAIFSLRLDGQERSVLTQDWADFVLRPYRSTSFHLNKRLLATTSRPSVGAVISVAVGRVAAASLGATNSGGIRSSLGITAPERSAVLPGGPDAGRSILTVDGVGTQRVTIQGTLHRTDGAQALGQLQGQSLQPGQSRSYDLPTQSNSTMNLTLAAGDGFAAARRAVGATGEDDGSTAGASAPKAAWVIPSAAVSLKDEWRLVLSNTGREPAIVKLWLLSAAGLSEKLSPRVVTVSPGRTRTVAEDFTFAARAGSVVAVSSDGTFVPLAASYTAGGGGFATAVGVPIPPRFVPARFG